MAGGILAVLGWLLLGAVAGVVTIRIGRRLSRRNEIRLYAVFLFLAGAIYLAFGAFHGPRWVALEGAGFALFSLLAWAGLRQPWLLALGWLLHAGWDGGLHLALEQPVIGPWLPLLCLPYDLLVAGWVAYLAGARRAA